MKSILVCTCISHVINPLESNQKQKVINLSKKKNNFIIIILNPFNTLQYTGNFVDSWVANLWEPHSYLVFKEVTRFLKEWFIYKYFDH